VVTRLAPPRMWSWRRPWRMPWSSPTSVESRCWIPCCPTERSAAWDDAGIHPSSAARSWTWSRLADRSPGFAQALGISDQSIYTWRRQDRIDRGLEPGLTSGEKAELVAAKRRIAELETEQTQRLPPARPGLDLDRPGGDTTEHGQGEHAGEVRWGLGGSGDRGHVLLHAGVLACPVAASAWSLAARAAAQSTARSRPSGEAPSVPPTAAVGPRSHRIPGGRPQPRRQAALPSARCVAVEYAWVAVRIPPKVKRSRRCGSWLRVAAGWGPGLPVAQFLQGLLA
jgi:hypothetical protein